MRFRRATFEDGVLVLENLREEQQLTIEKLGIDSKALLRKAINETYPSMTVIVEDQVAAVFGVMKETLLGEAKIWLITTPLIEKEPVAFLRASRTFTETLYAEHGPLIGMVDADFEKSHRWLRWIGFEEVRDGDFKVMRYTGGH